RLAGAGHPMISVRPGDFDLGSLASRVAARSLAKKIRNSQARIAFNAQMPRPEWVKPPNKPRWQDTNTEIFFTDDPDYETYVKSHRSGSQWPGESVGAK